MKGPQDVKRKTWRAACRQRRRQTETTETVKYRCSRTNKRPPDGKKEQISRKRESAKADDDTTLDEPCKQTTAAQRERESG